MSTITFNVSYNNITKKITVPKPSTINQVSEICLVKFAISKPDVVGVLYSNNKILEGSLPIRLTTLSNNSKLKLELKAGSGKKEVAFKFTINADLVPKTVMSKINADRTLAQLITYVEEIESIKLNLEGKDSQLVIMNSIYPSGVYKTTKLSSLGQSSLAIRMNYLLSEAEKASRAEEQQNIVKVQLERQKQRNEGIRLGKEREEVERIEKELEEERLAYLKEAGVEEEVKSEISEGNKEPLETKKGITETIMDKVTTVPSKAKQITSTKEIDTIMTDYSEALTESPSLYLPSDSTPTYENPDEDYNMTVAQAQTYRNLITKSGKQTPITSEPVLPQKYLFRIKFPDRSILQVNFISEANTVKLGQLIKKIDDLILERFVGKYNLKLSYPPFKKIEFSFSENNSFLHLLDDFQSERLSLIWELKGGVAVEQGPYIKTESIDIKSSSELPEVLLESHRSELPAEEAVRVIEDIPVAKVNREPKKKAAKGVPKWFRT